MEQNKKMRKKTKSQANHDKNKSKKFTNNNKLLENILYQQNKQNQNPNQQQKQREIKVQTPETQKQTRLSQSNISTKIKQQNGKNFNVQISLSSSNQNTSIQKSIQKDTIQYNTVTINQVELVQIQNQQIQNRQKSQRFNYLISQNIKSQRGNTSLEIQGRKVQSKNKPFQRSCNCCKNKKKEQWCIQHPIKILNQSKKISQVDSQFQVTAQIFIFKPFVQKIERLQIIQEYRLKDKIEYIIHNKIKENVVMRSFLQVDNSCFNYFWPQFRLYLNYNQKKILYAKKSALTLNSKYKIFTNQSQSNEQICVGKVISDFSGTNYNIYRSLNNKDFYLVCSVICNSNNEQPQQFQVYYLDELHDLLLKQYHPQRQINSLKQLINQDKFKQLIHKAHTRKPTFNQHLGIHTLDLNKRAKMNSSKNFILENNQLNQQILMLGKLSLDMYNCQITYPLNPIISLGIILSKFQNKMTV